MQVNRKGHEHEHELEHELEYEQAPCDPFDAWILFYPLIILISTVEMN